MEMSDFRGRRGYDLEPDRDDYSVDVHRLRQLVIKDDLTELYNRRYFKERLREEKRRGDLQGLPFSLMILDVDHFKEVNDIFGHVAGDKVLVEVARIIGESVREIDISCRYAGDEFVVILPGAQEEETERVIQRIINNLNSFLWEERTGIDLPSLTCSVGYTCYPDDARELAQLIKRADRALYWAKKQGRDCWVRWTNSKTSGLRDQVQSRSNQTLEMVGRAKERERLLRIIEHVMGGSGRSVIIEGEMGVGKTRLAQYAMMRLEHHGFKSLSINCFKETAEIPYFPLREAWGYLENSFEDELEEIIKKVDPRHLMELAKFYPTLNGSAYLTNLVEGDQQTSDEYQLFESFLQLFTYLSQVKPLVILVENLQWADFATRKLLNYLARSISDEGILLIALCRVGGMTVMGSFEGETSTGDEHVDRIKLDNLSKEESFRLIENLMGQDDLPDNFLKGIYDRTSGNPLFVEEMIKYLKRQGDISIDRNFEGEELSVPGSVTEMLRGQAEEIQEDKRTVLAMASVIGVEFSFDLLMLLSLKNEGFLLDVIDEAVKQGLIKEIDHPTEDRYAFINPLFRQVLYEDINKRRRRNLHKQIGNFLEKYYFDRVDELRGDLAFHYQHGGNLLKALEYSVKAGEKAEELYANQEAIHYFDRAIQIISSSRDEGYDRNLYLQLMEKKADILDLVGEYESAEKVYEEIIDTLIDMGQPKSSRARIMGKLGVIRDKKGESECAVKTLKDGMKLLKKTDGTERAGLLSSLADLYLREGRLDEAISCCKEGLNGIKDKDTDSGAQIYMTIGCTYLEKGVSEKAKFYLKRGIEIFTSIGNLKGLGRAYLSMGTLYYSSGKYNSAEEYYEKSLEFASKTGNVSLLLACFNNLGMIARVHSDIKGAVDRWEKGLVLAEKIEQIRYTAYLKNNLGNANRELGDYSLALSRLNDSLKLFQQLNCGVDIRRVNRGLAILYLCLGDPDLAEEAITLNQPEIEKGVDQVELSMNMDVLGRVCKEKKRYSDAEPYFLKALEGYRKASDPEDLTVGLMNTVDFYIDWGKVEKAIPYLDEGEKLAKKIRSKKLLAQLYCLRGRSILAQDKDIDKAVTFLKKANRHFQSIGLPYDRMRNYHALGLVFERTGKRENALREFRRAAEIVRYLKKKIFEPNLLVKFEEQPLVVEILKKASTQ
jgi:diguanylate cyclase (GGDEF)-like protein